MKELKKKNILEIIDDDDNLIGKNDIPQAGSNKESDASHTTDYNVMAHGQNFKNDFLGRFGFYFYESEGDNKMVLDDLARKMYEKFKETLNHYHKNPDNMEKDYELHSKCDFDTQPEDKRAHDYRWAEEILDILKPHMKKDLNEAKVVEDKIADKKTDNEFVKKTKKEISPEKLNKVADVLSKLQKNDLDKLISLIESKKEKPKTFKNVPVPKKLKEKFEGVSLGKDADGYYVYTHRARSDSYEGIDKIPESKIKHIETTG